MIFGAALECAKDGVKISRVGYPDWWVEVQRPDPRGMATLSPFLVVVEKGKRRPWSPAHEDLLSDDWILVTEVPEDIKFVRNGIPSDTLIVT